MAQWTETLEPYVKVIERVKTTTQNPQAGGSLIIGVVIISDAGSANPTLITSQEEFIQNYASQDLTQSYIDSLNTLYNGDNKTLAATMWANAYRLAGSNSLLCVRASKGNNLYFTKPLTGGTNLDTYVLRDGELLKKVPSFILKKSYNNEAPEDGDGWLINISGVGIFGNRVTDDGPMYDYLCNNMADLIDSLNDTSKVFCPDYVFIKNDNTEIEVDMDDEASRNNEEVYGIKFNEVYLGVDVIDTTDSRTNKLFWNSVGGVNDFTHVDGKYPRPVDDSTNLNSLDVDSTMVYVSGNQDPSTYTDSKNVVRREDVAIVREAENSVGADYYITNANNDFYTLNSSNTGMLYLSTLNATTPTTSVDLNSVSFSHFTPAQNYSTNVFNSATTLKVRIRRFNHNAVITRNLSESDTASLTASGLSPYTVLPNTIDTFTENESMEPTSESVLSQDFYEVAVWDPSISERVSFFNLGNITGRGDMEISELNSLLNMIQLTISDTKDLNLMYYLPGSDKPDAYDTNKTYNKGAWVKYDNKSWRAKEDGITEAWDETKWENIYDQIFCDLTIDPTESKILSVSDTDLKKALNLITLDEVYTTEGLCDLGNTNLSYQNYMANIAMNENYFYPISTVMSTNYMTIGNSASKISADSYKLYMSAPWDIDTGTLGWKFYASPSVLYWEMVAKNRRNNKEFAPTFGQENGTVTYQRPFTEFNRKTRQLLLSKKVNTALWDVQIQSWEMNDNGTKQTFDTIMRDDGNSRLMIRISKAMPTLLNQFKGKRISEKLCKSVEDVVNYFFTTTILPMDYSVDDYLVTCKYDEILARQYKIKVRIQVRYQRALKFIDVYNEALDLGMPFEE